LSKPSLRGAVAASSFVLALLAVAGVAVAAHPVKGATYKGKLSAPGPLAEPISFKVTSNGKRVHDFAITVVPVGCQGGLFGSPQPGSAAVTKQGKFKVTLKLYFAPAHRTTGKLVITGTFLAHGKETGKVSTVFTSPLYPKSCDKTVTYSMKRG
jgi:hypothetical protein